jgi:hypothetical protein
MFHTFGNKVRIKKTPETEELDLANKEGEVYGETTPSVTGLEIIGNQKEDLAINIHFEELGKSFWFSEDLLEYLDDGQGNEISLDGIDKKWTKTDNGEWTEENTKKGKKWWQFWG